MQYLVLVIDWCVPITHLHDSLSCVMKIWCLGVRVEGEGEGRRGEGWRGDEIYWHSFHPFVKAGYLHPIWMTSLLTRTLYIQPYTKEAIRHN